MCFAYSQPLTTFASPCAYSCGLAIKSSAGVLERRHGLVAAGFPAPAFVRWAWKREGAGVKRLPGWEPRRPRIDRLDLAAALPGRQPRRAGSGAGFPKATWLEQSRHRELDPILGSL